MRLKRDLLTSAYLSCVALAARGFKKYVYHQTSKGTPLHLLLPLDWYRGTGYDSVNLMRQTPPSSRPSSAGVEGGGRGGRASSRPTSVQSARSVDSGQTVQTSTEEVVVPEWEQRLQVRSRVKT